MPYLNEKPSFSNKSTPKNESIQKPLPQKHNPFTDPHPSRSHLQEALAKDADVIKQASYEGKGSRQLAKELLERFSHLDQNEIKKQLVYGDYSKIQHEMRQGHNTSEKYKELKHAREENLLLKKKFEIK